MTSLINRIKTHKPHQGGEYFQSRVKGLRAMGCWPRYNDEKSRSELCYTFITVALMGNSLFGTFLSFNGIIATVTDSNQSKVAICEHLLVFILALQICVKMIMTMAKAQKIEKLIDDLNGPLCRKYVTLDHDREVMAKCYKYDMKLSVFFFVVSFLLALAVVLLPGLLTIKKILSARSANSLSNDTSAEVLIGELPTKYPFQLNARSVWYVFWYIEELIYSIPGSWCTWTSDSMLCGLLKYLCGHFDILIHKIKQERYDMREGNEIQRYKKAHKDIVLHHLDLIRCAKDLINCFGALMVTQLLLAAITVGLVMVQLTLISGDPVKYLKPVFYIILKLVQLYLLSWNGQHLWDKSLEVGNALFSTTWYQKPKVNCVDVKFIIMRSQKPIKLAVNSIFQYSAKNFFHILNTAYSYYTVMRTIK